MGAGEINADTLEALKAQGNVDQEPKPTDQKPDTDPGSPDTKISTEETALEFKPADSTDVDLKKVSDDPKTDDPPDDKEKSGVSDEELKSVDDQLKEAGYDLDDFAKQIQENGKLSDEMIADLKTKFDPALVDVQLENMQLKVDANKTEQVDANKAVTDMNTYIFDSVGGEENFNKMSKLLAGKLSKSEISVLDAKLKSGNKLLVAEGMQDAVKSYNQARGMGGKLMSGEPNTQTIETVPRITKDDFRAIMKSEKYKTDPAYAAKMDAARMATKTSDKKSYGPGQYYGFTQNGRYEL